MKAGFFGKLNKNSGMATVYRQGSLLNFCVKKPSVLTKTIFGCLFLAAVSACIPFYQVMNWVFEKNKLL